MLEYTCSAYVEALLTAWGFRLWVNGLLGFGGFGLQDLGFGLCSFRLTIADPASVLRFRSSRGLHFLLINYR